MALQLFCIDVKDEAKLLVDLITFKTLIRRGDFHNFRSAVSST